MSRSVFTGSTDGLGLAAAQSLLDDRHEAVPHARSDERVADLDEVRDRASRVVAGLSSAADVQAIAD